MWREATLGCFGTNGTPETFPPESDLLYDAAEQLPNSFHGEMLSFRVTGTRPAGGALSIHLIAMATAMAFAHRL